MGSKGELLRTLTAVSGVKPDNPRRSQFCLLIGGEGDRHTIKR